DALGDEGTGWLASGRSARSRDSEATFPSGEIRASRRSAEAAPPPRSSAAARRQPVERTLHQSPARRQLGAIPPGADPLRQAVAQGTLGAPYPLLPPRGIALLPSTVAVSRPYFRGAPIFPDSASIAGAADDQSRSDQR